MTSEKKKKNQELKIKSRKNEADDTKELSLIFSIMMILQFCFLIFLFFWQYKLKYVCMKGYLNCVKLISERVSEGLDEIRSAVS